MKPTIFTWILAIFGIITFIPLIVAQAVMVVKPNSNLATDLLIGKGKSWRDQTHFRSALAFAWADLLLLLPILIISYIGVFQGHLWGYILWFAMGIISIYFSIIFWVMEKAYVYPSAGWIAYYTYFWGFFLYWGLGAVIYAAILLI